MFLILIYQNIDNRNFRSYRTDIRLLSGFKKINGSYPCSLKKKSHQKIIKIKLLMFKFDVSPDSMGGWCISCYWLRPIITNDNVPARFDNVYEPLLNQVTNY